MTEKWLPVVGYEGLYEVSDLGRVRGVDRLVVQRSRGGALFTRKIQARAIKTWLDEDHYERVRLGSGTYTTFCVHQLVAKAFLGPPPEPYYEVCHREGAQNGSTLDNLYWGTRSENRDDARRHGTLAARSRHGCAKLTEEQVSLIRGSSLPQSQLALQHGVSQSEISHIRNGVTWR